MSGRGSVAVHCCRNWDGHRQDVTEGAGRGAVVFPSRAVGNTLPNMSSALPAPRGHSSAPAAGDTCSASPLILAVPNEEFLFSKDSKISVFKGSVQAGRGRFSEESAPSTAG